MRDKDVMASDAHFEALTAGRDQQKWSRMEKRGKDAGVPLRRLPKRSMRVDCTFNDQRAPLD
eukprot:9498813-Pyramimonas_sp.AAC.1